MNRTVAFGLIVGLLVFAHVNAVQAINLKIATLSPDGSSWMIKMRAGAAEVEQRTDGRVRFKFYPGGVMGDDNAVLRKIHIGQLQGGAVTNGALERFYPDGKVYNLPIKFESDQQLDYVRQRMDPVLAEGFKKGGFITFGLVEGGFAYIMSKNAVMTVEDLRNQKIWIPKGDEMGMAMSDTFGVTPIPLTTAEVRTALQTGLINTVAVTPIGAIALQWHTQINYVVDAPLIYVYAFLTIEKKAFSKLSPADQAVVSEVMTRVMGEIDRQNRADNISALEVLKNQGIRFIKPDQAEIKRWREFSSTATDQLISSGKLSRQIVDQLELYLEEYKKAAASESGSK
jgi:TRAP-type C4-dicarboxylate transport system substrate-binding protein